MTDRDLGSDNADLGIFSKTWATMRLVTRLIIGTPRVANEGGSELTARKFRCPEAGSWSAPVNWSSYSLWVSGSWLLPVTFHRPGPSWSGCRTPGRDHFWFLVMATSRSFLVFNPWSGHFGALVATTSEP
ncbi:hypothetical protein U1Q18_019745 [Sarracenia purpurea var. burkii]